LRLLTVIGSVAAFTCAASLCSAPATALASVKADDAAATRAYLRASEQYTRDVSAEVGASAAAVAARAQEIAAACPSALTYAPRDPAFGEIGEEARSTLFYAAVAPTAGTRLAFAHVVGRLSWSDSTLNRLVRGEAAEEEAVAALAQPDVCADIEAWKKAGYAALPQSAAGFLARVTAIESGDFVGRSEELREVAVARLLRPYEDPGERQRTAQLKRRERDTDKTVGAAVEAAMARLADALGVSVL
jgi:hypothetical protein